MHKSEAFWEAWNLEFLSLGMISFSKVGKVNVFVMFNWWPALEKRISTSTGVIFRNKTCLTLWFRRRPEWCLSGEFDIVCQFIFLKEILQGNQNTGYAKRCVILYFLFLSVASRYSFWYSAIIITDLLICLYLFSHLPLVLMTAFTWRNFFSVQFCCIL